MADSKRKAQYAANRKREEDLQWNILRSRDKYHLTSLLLAEMLKVSTPEYFHIQIDKILEADKNEVARMLLEFRAEVAKNEKK